MAMRKDPEAIRQARREYQREWRKANPDRVRAAQLRFWQRKAAEMKAAGAEIRSQEGQDNGKYKES